MADSRECATQASLNPHWLSLKLHSGERGYTPTLYDMAAAYAYHLCQNHPFVDGNKRTALACALVFLELNGMRVLEARRALKNAMVSIASGHMNKAALVKLLRGLPGN